MKKWLVLFMLLRNVDAVAQPFIDEIRAFQKSDSISFPKANKILFIGSSSFRYWKDVQQYFPKHAILNRGFGGSQLVDVIRYQNQLIYPYKPKQIVLYCGENDAVDEAVSASEVVARFIQLYKDIREKLPTIPFLYISIKPSPSRWHLHQKFEWINQQIASFLKKEKNAIFINVYPRMLNKNGKPSGELFSQDSLHMNAKGYQIWKQALEKELK